MLRRDQRNAAALTNQPRVEYEEVQPLTAEEIGIFQSAIQGHRLEALFATSLIVGWRLGEALGLTWNDVDFDERTIQIRQALTRHDGAYHLAEPKTDRSRRTVPMPALVVDHLRAHRTRQMEEQLFAGAQWEGQSWGLVFATTSGAPLSQAVVTHQFQAVLKKAGLRHQRFHDLRHCAASVMLSAGTPMRVVQEVLGHSDMSTTANLYSHVAPSLTRDALDRVGEMLTPATNRSVS